MSDWIEWKGGECPVAMDVRVQYMLRDGMTFTDPAAALDWEHKPYLMPEADIVRYRLAAPLETGAPSAAPAATHELVGGCTCKDSDGMATCWRTNGTPDCMLEPAATPRTNIDRTWWRNQGADACIDRMHLILERAETAERESADLRGKLANEINIAAGWKATAEVAEAKLATARADERERCAKMLEARAESVEGPTNAYAVGELYEAALAIRALKEASNG